MAHTQVPSSDRFQKHGTTDTLGTDVPQANDQDATNMHADPAVREGIQRMNEDQKKAMEFANTDNSLNGDYPGPGEPQNLLERADTQDSEDSDYREDSRGTSTEGGISLPGLEGDTDSSIHGRFWDSQSVKTDNSEPDLPHLSDWKPIRDQKRLQNLENTLSHPNKDAVLDAWKCVICSNHQPPGQYTSDMADVLYRCFKVRNYRSSACSAGQGY